MKAEYAIGFVVAGCILQALLFMFGPFFSQEDRDMQPLFMILNCFIFLLIGYLFGIR
jgi:hypothetical protein